MNLASIVPPPAAPAATPKAPAGSGNPTGAAGFLAVLATKFAATASSGSSAPADAAGEEVDGMVAQDLLTLAALASRTASAALPHAVPAIALPVEAGAEEEACTEALTSIEATPIEAATDAPATVGDAAVPSSGDLDEGSALLEDVVASSDDAHVDVVGGDGSSPETTGALSDVEGDGAVIEAAVDDAPATTTSRQTTAEPTAAEPATEPTTTGQAAATGAAAGSGGAAADQDGDDLAGQRAVPATPAARGRGRADEAPARTRVDGAGTVRTESVGAPTQAAPGSAAGAVRIDSATPSAAAQRVLDLVTQLEDAPPPRVVVIDTGEIRVRLGLDAGTVRMTVLGPLGETGEELLREAADALEAGGFGTELDRGADGEERDGERAGREDRPAPTTPSSRRPAASSRAGLQL